MLRGTHSLTMDLIGRFSRPMHTPQLVAEMVGVAISKVFSTKTARKATMASTSSCAKSVADSNGMKSADSEDEGLTKMPCAVRESSVSDHSSLFRTISAIMSFIGSKESTRIRHNRLASWGGVRINYPRA